MILNDTILQDLLPEDGPGSRVYKKIDAFDFVSLEKTRNVLKNQDFYFNHYTQSVPEYENSIVNLFYTENCSPDSKTISLFFGSKRGLGASNKEIARSGYSDTRAIYSKVNYMFDYTLVYENIYALEFHTNKNYDYLNSSYFEIALASYDDLGNLSETLYTFICSGSSQYQDGTRYSILPLVSGSLTNGVYSNIEIGKFNPEKNMIVFNSDVLDTLLKYNTNYTITTDSKNVNKFYNSFSQSAQISVNSGVFPMTTTGTYFSNFFKSTLDIELNEFNYTNNPTFFDKKTKKFRTAYTNTNSNVYFTTIGLYDDKYQLLAVAKLSKALPKNDTEKYKFEVVIQIQ